MKTELNGYLFCEFGCEGDVSDVREDWPFVLRDVGSVDGENIFEFSGDGEEYFAISGRSLSFERKDGADLAIFSRQRRGASWIGAQGPVDLQTSRGEHPTIPMIPQRKARIAELASALNRRGSMRILEGLFLEESRQYLALVKFSEEDVVHVVGDAMSILDIPELPISSWKILSRAVGSVI